MVRGVFAQNLNLNLISTILSKFSQKFSAWKDFSFYFAPFSFEERVKCGLRWGGKGWLPNSHIFCPIQHLFSDDFFCPLWGPRVGLKDRDGDHVPKARDGHHMSS